LCTNRKRFGFVAPALPADVARQVGGVEVDGVQDQTRRVQDLPPDAVAGK